jgi:O-antigen ligase
LTATLVVDYENLPAGWELPKVHFLQISLLIVSLFYFIAARSLGSKRNLLIVSLLLSFLLISSLVSEYSRDFDHTLIQSPLYSFIDQILDISKRTAIWGNIFRDLGFISIGIMIIALYTLYNAIDRKNYHVLLIVILIAGIIQAIIGITQAVEIFNDHRLSIADGRWVYGTFGQTNFYAGIVLCAISIGFYYLRSQNKFLILTLILSLILLTSSLILSMSIWGIICLFIFLVMYLLIDIVEKSHLAILFGVVILALSFLLFTPLFQSFLPDRIYQEHFFRLDIWNNILILYIKEPLIHKNYQDIFLGTGFDTLGDHFITHNVFEGKYVDRAHNQFLQILSSTGIIMLFLYISSILVLSYKAVRSKNREFAFIVLILLLLNIRGILHTNSILNLLLIGIFISLAYNMQAREKVD